MSEIKLKSCPFCGGDNVDFWETDSKEHPYQIICFSCCNGTDKCRTEEIAITRWNTRKPMQEIVERLEGIEDEIYLARESIRKNIWKDKETLEHSRKLLLQELAYHNAIEIVKEVGGMND